MNIVIVGHVDHGKSTIVGRLLADTGSLPEGKLEQVKALCAKTAKPFEYAFLLDALKEERNQGITIDSARVFFKSARREYILIDAPGHIEFIKNMLSGAARGEAALLVIDVKEGVRENSRRHAYLLSLLGVRKVVVLMNKMDLAGYDREVFERTRAEFQAFLAGLGVEPRFYIPISGFMGDNITAPSSRMPWYDGPCVLDALDLFDAEGPLDGKPFRMYVQDIYKFTKEGDSRRIVAGTAESGVLSVGDDVVFYPSGKSTRVKSIEAFNEPERRSANAGKAFGFTMEEQIYVARGEVICRAQETKPQVSASFSANIFWLGKAPMALKKEYLLKIGTARVPARVVTVKRVLDTSNLEAVAAGGDSAAKRNEVVECVVATSRPVAFDAVDVMQSTSRFVIVDNYMIVGVGIITGVSQTAMNDRLEKVILRNLKWEKSLLASERRISRMSQKPTLILITGPKAVDKKRIAKALEEKLFNEGRFVYFLGISNILYGVDADIRGKGDEQNEHMRRLSEVAHLMLDAGLILIVTASDLREEDLNVIKLGVDYEKMDIIWVGDDGAATVRADLYLPDAPDKLGESVERIVFRLQDNGVIFRTQ